MKEKMETFIDKTNIWNGIAGDKENQYASPIQVIKMNTKLLHGAAKAEQSKVK